MQTESLCYPAPHLGEKPEDTPRQESKEETTHGENSDESSENVFNVTIQLPGGDDIEIQVSPKELVQEIIQVLMEHEDSCHRTCFSLQFEGNVLDNFSELKSVAGLKDGSILKVVEEPYTIREARIHIRHFRDLLKSLELTDAYNGIDCSSLSFLSNVSEGDIGDTSSHENSVKKKKRSSSEQGLDQIDCSPPEFILPGSTERPLQALHPTNLDKPPQCLKSLMMSGWNPPPGNRRMHGDLMYLTVVTMEDHHINITSSNRGFYINQSTTETFNPKPSSPSHLSHSIVELLNLVSPSFKKNFVALQKKRVHRHPLERIATPYQVYCWIAPNTNHIIDCVRAEDAYNLRLGYEEHIPGQTRDWNEELQTTRELPRELPADQQLRQRANFKINSDFVGASTRGAMAVIDGNVMAINPGEETKMQMFIWNNIFFSFGFDVRDHYKDLGGDHAAHVASSHDLKGVQAYSDLDIEELYVLGTVVLDYRGYRVTAQSIIPGILDRKEDQSVLYGSIDFGKTVSTNSKYLSLLHKACKPLRILRHAVLNEKNEELILCSSVECKGIVGNDGRHYILDLLRTFPPDVNFLPLQEEYILPECRNYGFPKPYRHRLCNLRQELLEVFVQHKYTQFMNIVMEKSQKGELLQPEKDEHGNIKDELKGADIVKEACQQIGSVSDYIFDIQFNPDVYSPVVRFPESQNKAIQIQKRLLSEAAAFILTVQIPNFIKACLSHIIVPLDGKTLTEALHLHGINVRYLGTVATMIDKLEVRPSLDHLYRIIITEIVTRSAKAILRRYLQGVETSALSAAVSHFVNCFLSSYPNPVAHLPPDELISRRKKNKKKIRSLENGDSTAWTSMTPADLWKQIQRNAKDSFDFTLSSDSMEHLVEKLSLQKVTLLREFCIKAGVQVLLREYNFESRHKPALTEEDILNIFPIVKHINIKAKEANRLFQKAQISIQQGGLNEGVVLLNEALALFNSTYGALHPEIAVCLRLLARIKFLLGDIAEALDNQQKAVIMTERTLGYDSTNAIQDYVLLSHYCFASGQLPVSLKLLYRARYLMLVIAGEDHPTMATLDSNIGVVLQAVFECDLSLRFLDKALEANKKYYGMKSLDVALSHHLIALAYTSKAEFRAAMQHEKETYTIYKAVLGDAHERTRESSAFLKHVTQQAVNLQRTMNEIYKNGSIATLPHVQIVPPGIDTLLQQLNLLNGISRISVGINELDDNSNSIQNKRQNSTDSIDEQIEHVLNCISAGKPKDGDDKKDGGEQSKDADDKKDGGGQSKGADGKNNGGKPSKDGDNKENGGDETSKDSGDAKDGGGDQSKDGDDKKEGSGDKPKDGDDKKDSSGEQSQDGDNEDSKDGDDKKEDSDEKKEGNDEQSKDGDEKKEDSDERKKGDDEQSKDGDDKKQDSDQKKEGDDVQSKDGDEKKQSDSEQSKVGEDKKDGEEEQSKDVEEKKVSSEDQAKDNGEKKEEREEQSIDNEEKKVDEEQSKVVEEKKEGDSKEQSKDGEEKKEGDQDTKDGEEIQEDKAKDVVEPEKSQEEKREGGDEQINDGEKREESEKQAKDDGGKGAGKEEQAKDNGDKEEGGLSKEEEKKEGDADQVKAGEEDSVKQTSSDTDNKDVSEEPPKNNDENDAAVVENAAEQAKSVDQDVVEKQNKGSEEQDAPKSIIKNPPTGDEKQQDTKEE